jgi:hypothetical protein
MSRGNLPEKRRFTFDEASLLLSRVRAGRHVSARDSVRRCEIDCQMLAVDVSAELERPRSFDWQRAVRGRTLDPHHDEHEDHQSDGNHRQFESRTTSSRRRRSHATTV